MKYGNLSCVVFFVALLGLQVYGAAYGESNQPGSNLSATSVPKEVAFVAAGIANARQQVRFGHARIDVNESLPEEWAIVFQLTNQADAIPPKTDGNFINSTHAWWYLKGTTISESVDLTGNYPQQGSTVARVFVDEQRGKTLDEIHARGDSMHLYHLGRVHHIEDLLENGLWRDHEFLDPRFYAYYSDIIGRPPLDELFTSNKFVVTFGGEDTIDGSHCFKVELHAGTGDKMIYWIDADHSFVKRRTQKYQQSDGKLRLKEEADVSRMSQTNNIWLPVEIHTTRYLWFPAADPAELKRQNLPVGPKIPQGRIRRDGNVMVFPPKVTTITISDLSVDSKLTPSDAMEIPPSELTLDWPLGTKVVDTIDNKEFTVVTSQQTGDATSQNNKNTNSGSQSVPLTPPTSGSKGGK